MYRRTRPRLGAILHTILTSYLPHQVTPCTSYTNKATTIYCNTIPHHTIIHKQSRRCTITKPNIQRITLKIIIIVINKETNI